MKVSQVKTTVSSRITREQKQLIEKKAKELQTTKSELIRNFLKKYL